MRRLLLVEDDENIAQPLLFGLKKEGFEVFHAKTGPAGLVMARQYRPDVILLDVMLPEMDGYTVCRILRQESAVPILMITARGQELERVMGLEVGADDYIVKPFSFRELVARIQAMLRRVEIDRQGLPHTDYLAIGEIVLDRSARQVTRNGKPVELSRREFELLQILMEHAGQALSRQELLDAVWGEDWVGTPRTLDVHIRWLREKLEADPANPRYIETVHGFGYRFNRLEREDTHVSPAA